jgi:hypothetical protein
MSQSILTRRAIQCDSRITRHLTISNAQHLCGIHIWVISFK